MGELKTMPRAMVGSPSDSLVGANQVSTDRVTGWPTVTPREMGVSPLLIIKTDRNPPLYQVFSYRFWGR